MTCCPVLPHIICNCIASLYMLLVSKIISSVGQPEGIFKKLNGTSQDAVKSGCTQGSPSPQKNLWREALGNCPLKKNFFPETCDDVLMMLLEDYPIIIIITRKNVPTFTYLHLPSAFWRSVSDSSLDGKIRYKI